MIKMRESIYLFKSGFRPVWEDRRNINGGSWTFRVPKANGPDVWTRVQLLAIGEVLEAALDKGEPLTHPGYQLDVNIVQMTSCVASAFRSASTPTSSPSGTATRPRRTRLTAFLHV
jgi:hypothetical protein